MTTASEANALAAHAEGAPDCRGQVGLIADFTRSLAGVRPASRRRRRESSGSGHEVPAAGSGRDRD